MTEYVPVPCGFGPPGELPSPLPSGVDGGIIVIPGGGGPVNPDPSIIIVYTEPVPGIPSIPNSPSTTPEPPIIGDPQVTVTHIDASISYTTNIPTNVSCGLYLGNQLVQVFTDLFNYQLNRTVVFNNLLPTTLYNFILICRESSIYQLKTIAKGGFLTTAHPGIPNPPDPIGTTPSIILIEPPNPFPPVLSPDPSIIIQQQDPPVNPELIGDPYAQFIINSAQNPNEFDLKYTPYTINQTGFLPTYAEEYTNIFNKIRHKSIQNILKKTISTFEVANLDNQNINYSHIKSSLTSSLNNLNLKYANGIKISEQLFLDTFFKHIQNDTLNKIDIDYLTSIFSPVSATPTNIRTNILPSKYGTTKNQIISSRRIGATPAQTTQNTQQSQKKGLQFLKEKLISINPDNYKDDSSKLLNLWYCLPTDINQSICMLNNDGSISKIYLTDNDSIQLYNSTSSIEELYAVNNNTFFEVSTLGSVEYLYTESDINRSYSVRNEDEHFVMHNLGIEKDILLEVSCINELAELEYDLEAELDSHYILQLNTSTLSESNNLASPMIIETEAYYTLIDKQTSSVEGLNDDIKFKAYPWLTLNIDSDDPIFDYFINPDCTSNSFKFTFKDLTYRYISDIEDKTVPIIPRKIPRFIVILPTDRTKFNFFNEHSFVKDWNVRSMRFICSPDSRLNTLGLLDHPFIIENTYLNSSGESNSGYFDTQSYHCRYTSGLPTFNVPIKQTSSLSNRLEDGFRKTVKIVSSLYTNFDTSGGLTWYDILSRLERRELYTLTRFTGKEILNKLRSGSLIPIKIYHVRGPQGTSISQRRSGTRLIGLKENGENEYEQKYAEVDVIHLSNSSEVDLSNPPQPFSPGIPVL